MLDLTSQDASHLPIDTSSFAFAPAAQANHPSSTTSSNASPTAKTEDGLGDIPFASFDDDLDHRKRRRNRTTQSCWSCHQAKRKCDRKRPCSRCIQLGLTGLCVYETDDPASRDDPTLTESQRLRKRIAELEALVREMKNKPHPRWADKVSSGNIGVDKWHTRAKYVVGGAELDEYGGYRFPPMVDDGSLPPPAFDDSRRMSIASSSVSSSSNSPRTPLVYHTGVAAGGCGLATNPCSCLSSSPSTARALANAIRTVVLESGVGHPYAEGCKVLALVRELDGEASPTSTSSSGSSSNPQTTSWDHPHSHSNTSSPNPHHPHHHHAHTHHSPMTLPHASLLPSLPQLPHSLITPPTPTSNNNTSSTNTTPSSRPTYYSSHSHSYSYANPADDLSRPTVPSMTHSHSFAGGYPTGVEYSSTSGKFGLGIVG